MESNFNSGDYVFLKTFDNELEVYRVDYLKLNSQRYSITLMYSNVHNGTLGEFARTKVNFDCEYPIRTFNRDGRLVSQKLLQLLYD